MKIILLSLAVAFLIISIHQLMTLGIVASYPFFMFTAVLIIGARLIAVNQKDKDKK